MNCALCKNVIEGDDRESVTECYCSGCGSYICNRCFLNGDITGKHEAASHLNKGQDERVNERRQASVNALIQSFIKQFSK